jgi:hypothetical protein
VKRTGYEAVHYAVFSSLPSFSVNCRHQTKIIHAFNHHIIFHLQKQKKKVYIFEAPVTFLNLKIRTINSSGVVPSSYVRTAAISTEKYENGM